MIKWWSHHKLAVKFLVSAHAASDPNVSNFNLLFFLAMKRYPTAAKIAGSIWNSAVLCFKWLFHIGVWMFARLVWPLLATILCTCEIWSPRLHVSRTCISLCQKKKKKKKKKKACHHTDFEADLWPETGDFLFFDLVMILHILRNYHVGSGLSKCLTPKRGHDVFSKVLADIMISCIDQWEKSVN